MSVSIKTSEKSISGKIIVFFCLACLMIASSVFISYTSIKSILKTVNQLSVPNPKLQLVNRIFRDVVLLDQSQRSLISGDKQKTVVPGSTASIQSLLDSLRAMSLEDSTSLVRIDSVKKMLRVHDRLFADYRQLNKNLLKVDTLRKQIKTLNSYVGKKRDTGTVTTVDQFTTTIEDMPDTTAGQQKKQSFLSRVFGKKKAPEPHKPRTLVRQQYKVKIDTVALQPADSSIYLLGSALEHSERSRYEKRNRLIRQQKQLTGTSGILLSQCLTILQEFEGEETELVQQKRVLAEHTVNSGIGKISLLLLVFIVATGIFVYIIINDVAKSKRYRLQLQDAKEHAEQLGIVKQRFLANMSHELRNPLQNILGITEQLEVSESSRKNLQLLQQSSGHLLHVVNEVLDYSLIISGKFRLEQKAFDIVALLEEVKAIAQYQAAQKGIALHTQFDLPAPGRYVGDAFRLKQVLYNLIGNAVKFTDKGSVSISVAGREQVKATRFYFTVADTGIGIEENEIEQIFNQFEQATGNMQAQKGTGLGLSIVKQLVHEQQGTIEVSSTPGKGSAFTVMLEFEKAGEATATDETGTRERTAYHKKVWILDDDSTILHICSHILDKHHIAHTSFSSVAALLATPVENGLGVIFLDIRMPEMNGMDLCRLLKQKLPSAIRLIAITAQALPQERDEMLAAGFDAVLIKPFLEKDMIGMLGMASLPEPMESTEQPAGVLGPLQALIDDEAQFRSILQQFYNETVQDIANLKLALTRNDATTAAAHLHRLAGRTGQLGFMETSTLCRKAELGLREGTWDRLLLDKVCAALTALVAETAGSYQLQTSE